MRECSLEAETRSNGLRRAAWFVAYSAMPVYAIFAGGSAATFLAIATVLLLADALRSGQLDTALTQAFRQISGSAPLILALLFAALGWLSLLWSPWPADTVRFATNITGVLALAVAWLRLARAGDMADIERMILLGIVVASGLLLLALYGIVDIRAQLVARHQDSPFNRSILIVSTFAAVLVALAFAAGRRRALGWAALILAAIVAFNSGSETSQLFLLAFPPLLALFFLTERFAGWLSALVAPLIYFVFPLLVPLMRPLLDMAAELGYRQLLVSSSAMARQEIWTSFLNTAMQRPILGWGLGTERHVPLASQAMDANGLGPWTHAHSLPVQVLANLGLTGFILAGGAITALCLTIGGLPKASRAPAFALVTAMLVVWSISHGAWQSWWLAVVALALVPLFVQGRKET